jgi:lysozyme
MNERPINEKGLAIIKESEGLSLTPYICPGGYPSIGYGNRTHATEFDIITEQQAEQFLQEDLEDTYYHLAITTQHLVLTDNQWSALVSFVYNVGIGKFIQSTLSRKLKAGDYEGAGNEFRKWVYANGKKLPGLIKRREKERSLFLEEY